MPAQLLITEPKKIYLRGRNGFVWFTLSSTPSSPFLPGLLIHLCLGHTCHPNHCLTDWGWEPLSAKHISLISQWVKCNVCRNLSTLTSSFTMRNQLGTSTNMLRNVGSQRASIPWGATWLRNMISLVTHSPRNLNKTRGTEAGGGHITCLISPGAVESIKSQAPKR